MSAKDKDMTAEADKSKRGWEYRSGRFVLRAAGVLFFIGYVFTAAPMAWTWSWSAHYKSEPLSALDGRIEKALSSPNQSELLAWVNLRDKIEREIIREKLEPHTGYLDPFLFLFYSRWAVEDLQAEEIIFWHMYARYRLRYDALRCGAPDSVINMRGLLQLMPTGYIDAILERWPHLLKPAIQRVLDYDAEYPAANNPARICEVIYNIEGYTYRTADRKHWAAIRHTLRKQTEFELLLMDENGNMRDLRPAKDTPQTDPDKEIE
jgi:hypothetical protein